MDNQVVRTPLLILIRNTIKQRRRAWDFKEKLCTSAKPEILPNRTGLWRTISLSSLSTYSSIKKGLCDDGFRIDCLANNGA